MASTRAARASLGAVLLLAVFVVARDAVPAMSEMSAVSAVSAMSAVPATWAVDPQDPGPSLPPAGHSLFDFLTTRAE